MQLSDPAHGEREWSRLVELLKHRPSVVRVEGRAGSGRRALLARLSEEKFAVTDAPPVRDPDSALAIVLELAAQAGGGALAEAQQDREPLTNRMKKVVARLGQTHRGVAVRLAEDSTPSASSERDALEGMGLTQLRDVLRGWAAADFPLIVLGGGAALDDLDIASSSRLPVRSPLIDLEHLDTTRFGALATNADNVVARFCKSGQRLNPLELRWWVGLATLEEESGATVPSPPELSGSAVARRFAGLLLAFDDLRAGALRLALARRRIPREEVTSFAPADPRLRTLLLDCAAYGDRDVQMHELLRRAFLAQGGNSLRQDRGLAHGDLASAHGKLDGTDAIDASPSPRDWLERAHHLPRSGPSGLEQWRNLKLFCREFYWDCGRGLSLAKLYSPAADVFADCLRIFDPKAEQDAYAQHYLGFNLDRAGRDPERAEAALRRAVELDGPNVWWNCRLVTFLIDQARFLHARRQWSVALANVDPDDYEVARDSRLARHMHRWVVEAWLDVGEVELAREVFDGIPPDIVVGDEYLVRLEERLVDAEEARQLGESVYPEDVRLEDRWQAPLHLPKELPGGATLKHWYPGRVVESDADSVVLVFAVPSEDPAQRRTKVRVLTAEQWAAAARRTTADASGFVEIGVYDDAGTLLQIELYARARSRFVDVLHETRYLRRWRR